MSPEDRFASLTPSLLARKGDAEPALEPFAYARMAETARQMSPGALHELDRQIKYDKAPAQPDPVSPQMTGTGMKEDSESEARSKREQPNSSHPVHMIERLWAEANKMPLNAPAAPAPAPKTECRKRQAYLKRRAAVTFRMPTHDFLRLKLASAELETSCQNIILAALEAYLDAHGVEPLDDCNCLREASRLASETRR